MTKTTVNLNPKLNPKKSSLCNLFCKAKITYKNSSCSVNIENNYLTYLITSNTSSNNTLKSNFMNENNISISYTLKKIIPYIPPIHQIEDSSNDMEVHLYHENKDQTKYLIVSILINKNDNITKSSDFLWNIINPLRTITLSNQPKSISVSNNWNPNNLLPVIRSFYTYSNAGDLINNKPEGTKTTYIIYENNVNINSNDFNILNEKLNGKNNRISNVKYLNNLEVFYNNDLPVGLGSSLKGKSYYKCQKVITNKGSSNIESSSSSSKSKAKSYNFFTTSGWYTIRTIIVLIILFASLYYLIFPSLNYSYDYNKLVFEVCNTSKPIEIFDPLKKKVVEINVDNLKSNNLPILPDDLPKYEDDLFLINKYVKKIIKIKTNNKLGLDLSADTFFNRFCGN